MIKQTMLALAGAAALGVGFAGSAEAGTLTLDFEEFSFSGSSVSISESQGFTFTPAIGDETIVFANEQPNIPNTGSNTLLANGNFGTDTPTEFSLSKSDGGTFNLMSFLGAEGRNTNGEFFPLFGSTTIEVVGTFVGGEIISQLFSLDGFAEENDAEDFELFELNDFNNLISAQFIGGGATSGYAFSLDDIVISHPPESVPEPASMLGLLAIGAIAMGGALKKKVAA